MTHRWAVFLWYLTIFRFFFFLPIVIAYFPQGINSSRKANTFFEKKKNELKSHSLYSSGLARLSDWLYIYNLTNEAKILNHFVIICLAISWFSTGGFSCSVLYDGSLEWFHENRRLEFPWWFRSFQWLWFVRLLRSMMGIIIKQLCPSQVLRAPSPLTTCFFFGHISFLPRQRWHQLCSANEHIEDQKFLLSRSRNTNQCPANIKYSFFCWRATCAAAKRLEQWIWPAQIRTANYYCASLKYRVDVRLGRVPISVCGPPLPLQEGWPGYEVQGYYLNVEYSRLSKSVILLFILRRIFKVCRM